MKNSVPKLLSATIVIMLLFCISSLQAQRTWLGDDKDGGDGLWTRNVDGVTNWSPNWWPTGTQSNQRAVFTITDELSAVTANVTIATNYDAVSNRLITAKGKNVTINFSNGATLNTASWWQVGTNEGIGTGSANLTIRTEGGNSAEVTAGYFHIGSSNDTGGGNSLVFEGTNLVVRDNGTSNTVVGRFSNNNSLVVSGGADVERYRVDHGYTGGDSLYGNYTSVTGSGSRLGVTTSVNIGALANAYNNSTRVSNGGLLEVNTSLAIGNSAGSNDGGNYVEISNGGVVKVEETLGIYQSSSNTHGRNRLEVGDGGTLHLGGSLLNHGLLQLHEGGSIVGQKIDGSAHNANLQVTSGGILETRGSGLDDSVETTLLSGATWRVAVEGEDYAGVFDLVSTMNLESGSRYEVKIYSDGQIDQVHLDGGELNLQGEVLLALILDGYTPVEGQSWSLFTGDVGAIGGAGAFDISGLDSSQWDLSAFNEVGNWTISAIPEPQAVAMVWALVLIMGGWVYRRKRVC